MKEKLKSVGGLVVSLALMILICVLVAIFLRGSAWVSEKVLPILTAIGAITFFPLILVVLPLSIFKKCRPVCAIIFVYWSYLCGLCLWMFSLLVTIELWGYVAAIIGLFMAGIGVFPIAIIACMFKGEWSLLFQLILQFAFLIAARIYGLYLAGKAEEEMAQSENHNEFPLAPSSAVQKAAPGASRIMAGTAVEPRRKKPLRIITLDDEPFVLDATSMMIRFRFDDAIVLSFTDAEEALHELEREDPDLFTTDWNHPGRLHGGELLQVLANRGAKYPIFVMSAYAEYIQGKNLLRNFVAQGLNVSLISKPFTAEQLWQLMSEKL